jgi:hypothetical protein
MAFQDATVLRTLSLGVKSKGSANPLTFELPDNGYLSKIYLRCEGDVAGTLSVQNGYGFSSAIRRVELKANNGIQIHSFSGPGYHWAVRDFIDDYIVDPVGYATGRTAITATTFDISMMIPVAFNSRDPRGLINLQSRDTTLTLSVEPETDSVVATGATVSFDVEPMIEYFEVPNKPEDRLTPQQLAMVYSILEEDRVISGAGQFDYDLPRGYTYLGWHHLMQTAVTATPSDSWSSARLVAQRSDVVEEYTTIGAQRAVFSDQHGRNRLVGSIHFDRVGRSGFGMFGTWRDQIAVYNTADIISRLQLTAALTLKTVRRAGLTFLPNAQK